MKVKGEEKIFANITQPQKEMSSVRGFLQIGKTEKQAPDHH